MPKRASVANKTPHECLRRLNKLGRLGKVQMNLTVHLNLA